MDGGGIWKVKKGDGGGLGRSLSGRMTLVESSAREPKALCTVANAPLALCHAMLALDSDNSGFDRFPCTFRGSGCFMTIELCERRRVDCW